MYALLPEIMHSMCNCHTSVYHCDGEWHRKMTHFPLIKRFYTEITTSLKMAHVGIFEVPRQSVTHTVEKSEQHPHLRRAAQYVLASLSLSMCVRVSDVELSGCRCTFVLWVRVFVHTSRHLSPSLSLCRSLTRLYSTPGCSADCRHIDSVSIPFAQHTPLRACGGLQWLHICAQHPSMSLTNTLRVHGMWPCHTATDQSFIKYT